VDFIAFFRWALKKTGGFSSLGPITSIYTLGRQYLVSVSTDIKQTSHDLSRFRRHDITVVVIWHSKFHLLTTSKARVSSLHNHQWTWKHRTIWAWCAR